MSEWGRSSVQGVWFACLFGALAGGAACGGGAVEPEPTFIPNPGEEEGTATEVEGPRAYTFTDTDFDSLVYALVYAVPGTPGHDHVMRAASFSGSITWDSNDLSACQVDITITVEQLRADEDAMRDLVGFAGYLTDGEKTSVRNNMLDDDQLDAAGYPTMKYTATSCQAQGEGVRMTGDMTIHGVTKSLQMDFTPSLTTAGLYASGSMKFNHTDFGITPYKLFSYQNANEITLVLSIHGVPVD